MSNREQKGKNKATFIPVPEVEDAVRKVLSNTKEDSDRQLEEFQASNRRQRTRRQPKK